jgi:S-adenosylmethionine hydrolase
VRPVVLLTDFGLEDHYVGVLHSVVHRHNADAQRIDLCHRVPVGDVWGACFRLRCAWPHLPEDAVLLAVVDPGVGGERRAVAVKIGDRWIVAPDNGLPAAAGPVDVAVVLDWNRMGREEPSATFHGRDLFAPAAGRLARGDDARELGAETSVESLVACPLPEPVRGDAGLEGAVLHIDHFGNVVTNVLAAAVAADAGIRYGTVEHTQRVRTYGDAPAGEVVVLEGSSGLLELAVNGGSAAESTGLERGDRITVVS